jgi:hypothetical protein
MKSPLNRGGLRFFLVLVALIRGVSTPTTILAGVPLILLGAAVHFWAKGCLRQNRVVAMIGPYRFVRHPFYLANALIDAGIAVMSGWWVIQVVLPLWWLAIYIPVIRGEEAYLLKTFGSVYGEYKKRVPALVPWCRPLPSTGEGFRWSNPNIAHGEETPRALRILAYPFLFYVCMQLRAEGTEFFSDGLKAAALAVIALLYGLAWELERHQRRRRLILPTSTARPVFRAAVALGLVALALFGTTPRLATHDAMLPLGAALLALSLAVYSRRGVRALVAECMALVGVIALCGWLWLAAIPILLYMAWMLDSRLPFAEEADASCEPAMAESAENG